MSHLPADSLQHHTSGVNPGAPAAMYHSATDPVLAMAPGPSGPSPPVSGSVNTVPVSHHAGLDPV